MPLRQIQQNLNQKIYKQSIMNIQLHKHFNYSFLNYHGSKKEVDCLNALYCVCAQLMNGDRNKFGLQMQMGFQLLSCWCLKLIFFLKDKMQK